MKQENVDGVIGNTDPAMLMVAYIATQLGLVGNKPEVILHVDKERFFDHVEINEDKSASIIEEDLWVSPDDRVCCFKEANNAIGTFVMSFRTAEEMEDAITNHRNWMRIVVK